MRSQPSHRDRTSDPLFIAGWLFAELAMALVIIGFGTQYNPLATKSTAPSPPDTSTPKGTSNVEAAGLSLRPIEFVLSVPPGNSPLPRLFHERLREHRLKKGDVGLILLFGVSRDGNPLNGTAVSQDLAGQITRAHLQELSDDVVLRPFLGASSDGEPGDVKVELYVFTGNR